MVERIRVSSMKKKLGDLTLREVKEMQDKICDNCIICNECPFTDCCIDTSKIDLDKEVEVEKNDKNN